MNLLFRVIFSAATRSTHHKLALDALRYLRGADAERWRRLFLSHYQPYLEGSKAPDNQFKDFRNHVLHVRDGYWGGAPRLASQWYDRLLKSLRSQDWAQAAYDAGVLSHYYTDPLQPFHTAQSQAESNIHRAAEWSITKSYDQLAAILTGRLGIPDVEVPAGDDWLEAMVIAGADAANVHYEFLIHHYDFDRGVKDPPAGLDAPSREVLAGLLGHAAVGFARILEHAILEASVAPPDVALGLPGVLATLKIPVHWVTRKLHDAKDRKIVEAMYQELQETGRVEKTLPEDDRVVRELHRREVVEKGHTVKMDRTERPAAAPKPQTAAAHQEIRSPRDQPVRHYLELSSDVVNAPSIGPKTARRLQKIGVSTVANLLNVDPRRASEQIRTRHITAEVIVEWQDQARMVCRIPNLRGHDAQILVACGWRTPEQLAGCSATEVLAKVEPFATSAAGQRIIRSGKQPDLAEVRNWIDWAARSRQLRAA